MAKRCARSPGGHDVRLVVVIPAYNAEKFLPAVIDRVKRSAGERLLAIRIVDDGSTDGTATVASKLAADDARIDVIARPSNGGYGAAMKDGLRAARELDATVVACVHADGQYAPEELPRLVERLERDRFDLLQGSRIASGTALRGGMPLYKYLANRALTELGNAVFRMRMSDYYSGYLLYGSAALACIPFERLSNSFDFDLEVIASARAAGLSIGEMAVPTHYGDEVSHLAPVRYGLRVLRVFWNYQRGHYGSKPNPPESRAP